MSIASLGYVRVRVPVRVPVRVRIRVRPGLGHSSENELARFLTSGLTLTYKYNLTLTETLTQLTLYSLVSSPRPKIDGPILRHARRDWTIQFLNPYENGENATRACKI